MGALRQLGEEKGPAAQKGMRCIARPARIYARYRETFSEVGKDGEARCQTIGEEFL